MYVMNDVVVKVVNNRVVTLHYKLSIEPYSDSI